MLRSTCQGLIALALIGALGTGCGESSPATGEAPSSTEPILYAPQPRLRPAAPPKVDPAKQDAPAGTEASCSGFTSWREAQDVLDAGESPDLDGDGDGDACPEIGQQEYEEAFSTATDNACEAIFSDSPDGVLYYTDTGYEQSDCETAAPLPDQWSASASGDPPAEGATNGWAGACEDFFASTGVDALFWGDTVVSSQSDCELEGP